MLMPSFVAQVLTPCLVVQVLMRQAGPSKGEASTIIGTAEVELSLLHVMGQVSGWYNILNSR